MRAVYFCDSIFHKIIFYVIIIRNILGKLDFKNVYCHWIKEFKVPYFKTEF